MKQPRLRVGTRVKLISFWGGHRGPQDARVVEVIPEQRIPERVKVEPPLDGAAWWPSCELRTVRTK